MPNPGKGERAAITTRVPLPHKAAYLEAAQALGLDLSDYIALRLAEMHGLERPKWVRPMNKATQEVLPDSH